MDPFFDFVPLSVAYSKKQKKQGVQVNVFKLIAFLIIDVLTVSVIAFGIYKF